MIHTIDYYYPFDYEVSHTAARGHLKIVGKKNQEFLVSLNSTGFRKEQDLCLDILKSDSADLEVYSDFKFDQRLCMNEVKQVKEGFFKSLIPYAERINEVSDAHLIIYPLNPGPVTENMEYSAFKEKVKVRLFEILPHSDALLLGLFSITFLGGVLSYMTIFNLTLFAGNDFNFGQLFVVFLLLMSAIVLILLFTFNNFFLVVEENWRSMLLLLMPFGAPFSLFFWHAEKTKTLNP